MAVEYPFSFSGSDTRVYAYFDGLEDQVVELKSVQTVSGSVHEAKGQVRALGYKGIKGLTGSVRTVAGTTIMTVVNDHPLRPLLEVFGQLPKQGRGRWSIDRDQTGVGTAFGEFNFANRMATLLPPFNLLLHYTSEVAPTSGSRVGIAAGDIQAAGELFVGVEYITMGNVTSVHDVITEVTGSFIAHDYKPLASNDISVFAQPSLPSDIGVHEKLLERLYGARDSMRKAREEAAIREFIRNMSEDDESVYTSTSEGTIHHNYNTNNDGVFEDDDFS